MRDALSILDQAISMGDGKVEYKNVVDMLGLVTNENLLKLTDSIIEKDIENSMKVIDDIVLSGKDIYNFIKDMIIHFRNLLMVKVSQNPEEVLDMSDENIKLIKEQSQRIRVEEIMRHIRILQDAEEQSKWTKQSRIYLELSVIKMCKVEYDTSKEIILSRLNKLEESIKQGKIKITKQIDNPKAKDLNNINHDTKKTIQKKDNAKVQEIAQENTYSNMTLDIVKKNWKDILESFKSKHQMVLFAALTTGEVENCKNGIITIAYNKNYAFHKQRLEKPENQKIVESIFSDVLKERVSVRYIIDTGEDEISESKEQILKDTFGEDMVEILDE